MKGGLASYTKNMIVYITAELLGFENHIPPFATTFGLATLRGLNYASGTAGIRAETGSQLVITN